MFFALAAGAAIAVGIGNPWPDFTATAARRSLGVAIALLGLGTPLGAVAAAGRRGFLVVAAGVALTILLGLLLGRLFRVERTVALLISQGTGICGGSAIAAVGPAIGASSEAMSVSLAVVFALNGAAMWFLPIAGHALHLTQHQFAVWAAIAIHDTSSVVGAAASYGADALREATVLKLVRALWIVPATLVAPWLARRRDARVGIAVPWFIIAFVLAAAVRTAAPVSAIPWLDAAVGAGRGLLAITLFLIGLGITRGTLRRVGVRPLAQGAVLWVVVAAASLAAALRLR